MINIFSLFLVLLLCWIVLIASNGLFSWPYIGLGLVASLVISIIAWKIKIINRHSKFLFLNYGFYRHFVPLFLSAFPKSLFLIIKTSFSSHNQPVFYHLPIKKQNNSELLLFFLTIALMPGLLCLGVKEEKIIIHALDKKYFNRHKLNKIYNDLYKINDDRLMEENNFIF